VVRRVFRLDACGAAGHDDAPMKLQFRAAHSLSVDDVRKRIEGRVAHYAAKYPKVPIRDSYRWRDDRTVVGSYRGGEGVVQIGEDEVLIDLELPFFARAFKGRIEDFMRKEADAVLRTPG
jgi:hypothetical protein